MRQRGQISWAAATFILAMMGAGVGTVVGAYATFVTRSEYNRDIGAIKKMLEEIYRDRFGRPPVESPSSKSVTKPQRSVTQTIGGCEQRADVYMMHTEYFPCI